MMNQIKAFIFNDELSTLAKENKLRAEYLSDDNKKLLYKLVQRLRSSKLSQFDIQILQKDFIGMALEAEQRDETLSSVIGEDMNTFCLDLIKSGHRRTFKELIVSSLPYIILAFFLIYGINYIIYNSCPTIMHFTLHDLLFYMIWGILGVVIADYFYRKTVFQNLVRKSIAFSIRPVALILLLVFGNIFHSKDVILFDMIGWIPFTVSFLLLIAAVLLRNAFFRKLAKNYNWTEHL